MARPFKPGRKLRVILLADERLLPVGKLKDLGKKEREVRKTEFDVRDALTALGHDVIAIGVSDDLSTIGGAMDAHKPDIAFNLIEEFGGISHFDQHVVSFLELKRQAYTGCNPRGLTLARDKALTKKILAYEGLKVPEFAIFPRQRAVKRPASLKLPLFVKSLTEEGSVGISSASIVNTDEKLAERVEFIHRTAQSTAIAEEVIEGREIYVGVMGNDRVTTLPPWEFTTRNAGDKLLIATDRAKWDVEYQRQQGLTTGSAKLLKKEERRIAALSQRIYRALGLSGYARLDYRLTDNGDAVLLEANPNPQIAKDEDFAKSAAHIGMSYPELIEKLLRLGLRYKPTRHGG